MKQTPPPGMKIVDFLVGRDGRKKPSLSSQVAGLGASFNKKERLARQAAIGALNNVLGRRFTLFLNVVLPEKSAPIPMVLVGPTGIWAINLVFVKGEFRANGESWEEMEGQAYRPAKTNLLLQTSAQADVLRRYLASKGFQVEKIDPVLFLLDSGIHLDSTRPAVRLVTADAVGRFAGNLLQMPVIFENELAKQIIAAITDAIPDDSPAEVRDAYSLREEKPEPKKRKPLLPPELADGWATVGQDEPDLIKKVSKQASFTRKQWILLTVLLAFALIALIALILTLVASV